MANLRMFVSSTAYDLAVLRSSLRGFIEGLGYEPILSDYSDVLYDPREHAHRSCLAEVQNCDAVVLVVGSRYGSPLHDEEAWLPPLQDADMKKFLEGDEDCKISVTQAEALTAAAHGIPLFSFIDSAVYHDYYVYQQNKDKPFASDIKYPSISQPGTAEHIFSFIHYLENRSYNNAIMSFERLEDVIGHLRKQWAALFQRLLRESRTNHDERVRIDRLSEQFEDLKTALLTTVTDADSREVARAVIRFRRLIDVVRGIPGSPETRREMATHALCSWSELLHDISGVVEIRYLDDLPDQGFNSRRTLLIRENDVDLLVRMSQEGMRRVENDWSDFKALSVSTREVVYDALGEVDSRISLQMFRSVRSDAEDSASGADLQPSLSVGLED